MGSYYVQQSMLNRNSYFEMVLNGIDIEVYATFSAVGSINPSFANQTEAETFQGYISNCSNQSLFILILLLCNTDLLSLIIYMVLPHWARI